MGDDKLKVIAAELIKMVRKSVTIDWTLRETARAKIRVIVKRILNNMGLPARPAGRGREDRAAAGRITLCVSVGRRQVSLSAI